jgi:Sulfotransferase domain
MMVAMKELGVRHSRLRVASIKVLVENSCPSLIRKIPAFCALIPDGFNVPENPGDAIVWCRLGFAKAQGEPSDSNLFTAHSFDRVIGDCDAVTDVPCAIFGPEMLQAYPDAKVILNRRTDEEAWVRSSEPNRPACVWPGSIPPS